MNLNTILRFVSCNFIYYRKYTIIDSGFPNYSAENIIKVSGS